MSSYEHEAVAIIGLAAALPGRAKSLETLWDIILAGESTVSEVPADRFNIDSFHLRQAGNLGSTTTRHGNFLDRDLGAFDANFFSIRPQEAESIDPAQRILLETAYHALENAGLPLHTVAGSNMACYVGASGKDYESLLLRDPDYHAKYAMTGIGTAMLANRVSWFFDLRGASFSLDTGCSSSIIALHQACAALRAGESDSALVGGSNLSIVPDAGIIPLSNMGFLSPDGRCWSFDSRANGFGRADGQGFIVVKRFSDAVRDGNVIRAVVRSTALNQDGHTPGLTMPSADAQLHNILAAYKAAGLGLDDTKYFEAHGTGTAVGDLIEAQVIHRAFDTSAQKPLHVGSVKANLGHMEANAGLGGIFKSIFMLESGLIPRDVNAEAGNPNPAIPFADWGLKLAPCTETWPTDGVRRISLNSFGYGGANAHAILDDVLSYTKEHGIIGAHHLTKPLKATVNGTTAVPINGLVNGAGHNLVNGFTDGATHDHSNASIRDAIPVDVNGSTNGVRNDHDDSIIAGQDKSIASGHDKVVTNGTAESLTNCTTNTTRRLLILSSTDEAGIARLAGSLEEHLQKSHAESIAEQDSYLSRLAFTLSECRSRLPWKSFVLAPSLSELQTGLLSKVSKPVRSSVRPPITYILSGQGANYAEMGVDLIPVYKVFRDSIEKSDRLVRDMGSEWSLLEELHRNKETTQVYVPRLSQPLATALQLALLDLLESWGLCPTAVIGHSSGEIAAAYAIGALDHESAIKVAYYRGVVADNVDKSDAIKGSMSSVGLSETEIAPHIQRVEAEFEPQCVQVACVNSNVNVTLTGLKTALDALSTRLEEQRIFCRRLAISVPYHSKHMHAVSSEYLSLMGKLKGRDAASLDGTMYSSVTKSPVGPACLRDPQYWVDNLVGQVKFYPAFKELLSSTARPSGCKGQILEVAPHAVLQRSIRDILESVKQDSNFEYESLLFRNNPGSINIMNAIGRLACRNVPVSLSSVNNASRNETNIAPLTNLPSYPFNHETSYWHESRISINHRFRKYPKHELLGNRATDWNPLEPRWRNLTTVDQLPWLRERVKEGQDDTFVPPAAWLVMPIEALRQLHDFKTSFDAYELTNVLFPTALILASGQGDLELQTVLRPQAGTPTSTTTTSYGFTIFAWQDKSNDSLVVCSGTVSGRAPWLVDHVAQDRYDNYAASCTEAVDAKVFYRNIQAMGFPASTSYQTVTAGLKFNPDMGRGTAPIQVAAGRNETDYLIHPASLESLLQLNKCAIARGSLKQIPCLYPTSLQSLSVSASLGKTRAPLRAMANVHTKCFREVESSVVALDTLLTPAITALGLWESSEHNLDTFQSRPDVHVSNIQWKPDVSALSKEHLLSYLEAHHPCSDTNEGSNITANVCQSETSSQEISSRRMASFIDLMAHKNPTLRLLQLGEGAQGTTHALLSTLLNSGIDTGVPRFSEYTVTDALPPVLDEMRSKYASLGGPRMDFKIFDMEQDATEQGFEKAHYDVIVAKASEESCVASGSLKKVRSLLKDGGQLILYNTIGNQDWSSVFTDSGFSGLDYDLSGLDGASQPVQSVLVTTARAATCNGVPKEAGQASEEVVLVVDDKDAEQVSLAALVSARNDVAGKELVLKAMTLEQLDTVSLSAGTATYVFLLEASKRSFLKGISASQFTSLQHLITSDLVSVMWVTAGCGLSAQNPDLGLFTGLARTLTTERLDCRYAEVSLEDSSSAEITAITIHSALQRFLDRTISLEPEVNYVDGICHIPRVVPCNKITNHLQDQLVRPEPQPKLLSDMDSRPLTLSIKTPGDLTTLRFIDSTTTDVKNNPGPDEVVVRVQAVGLSSTDYLVASGERTGHGFGHEFSGTVYSTGASASFAVGDRVCGFTHSACLGTFVQVGASSLATVPSCLSLEAAASRPHALVSAYFSLVKVARIQPSDAVLIFGGASPAGIAAVQIATTLGTTVHVVLDRTDVDTFRHHLPDFSATNIHTDNAISPKIRKFEFVLHLDASAADQFESCLPVVAAGGMVLDASESSSDLSAMCKDAGITCTKLDFTAALEGKRPGTRGLLQAAEKLVPFETQLPLHIVSVTDLESAFDMAGHGKKVVVTLDVSSKVQVVPVLRTPYSFEANATYVVAGGFGGLGRSLLPWMADRGARYYIVLTRSGPSTPAAQTLVAELEARGVKVAGPKCDTTSVDSVRAAVEQYRDSMPPVRGALAAQMVLSDAVFENMQHHQWLEAIRPKVLGSWALHAALPKGMDFFIMISSIAGIMGAPGQANYAAANTYQDALARHRRAKGEHGIAIDLGAISGVGVAAERNLDDELRRRGMGAMPKPDLLACLEYCFSPGLTEDEYPAQLAQMVTGLGYFASLPSQEMDLIAWSKKPLYSILRHAEQNIPSQDSQSDHTVTCPSILLADAQNGDEATEIVLTALTGMLSRVLRVAPADIDASLPMYASGIDSLSALEVRNWFLKELAADVPMAQLMKDQSLFILAGFAADKSSFSKH